MKQKQLLLLAAFPLLEKTSSLLLGITQFCFREIKFKTLQGRRTQ
jgi:hypothetical protein